MKSPKLDTHLALADTANIKDKRVLVLFLLGLLLLSLDFWPKAAAESHHGYGIVVENATQPWRLINLPSADALEAVEIRTALNLIDHSQIFPLIPGQDLAPEIPAALSLFLNRPLPINRADKAALEMLPRVGPHLASAILKELEHQGRFAGPDDLLKVSGIGPRNSQQLLPLICFE